MNIKTSTETNPIYSINASTLPSLVKDVSQFFKSRKIEAYLVGGTVRDAFLNRKSSDIDISVNGDTKNLGMELASLLGGNCIPLDQSRDIVRVSINGDQTELIDLGPLHVNIQEDLRQRDFTIDAMAIPLTENFAQDQEIQLIDPYDGLHDLHSGIVNALSKYIFENDPVRLLRAPRLSAQLGFKLSIQTKNWIRKSANLILNSPSERLRDEFLKLITENSASSSLRLLDSLGLLRLLIPELELTKHVDQPKEHYWDVFNHSIETVAQIEFLIQNDSKCSKISHRPEIQFHTIKNYFSEQVSDGHTRATMIKLAGLLHDIAKPSTKTIEPSGKIRFLGHHEIGAQLSTQILTRLRFSNRGIDMVSQMVKHHLRPSQMSHESNMPTSRAIYRFYRDVGDVAIDTLCLNMADYLAARGPDLIENDWDEHCKIIGHIMKERQKSEIKDPVKLVNGNEIMKIFSIPPGPQIGVLLQTIQEAQAIGNINSKQQALNLIEANLNSSGGSGA